jgi:hypothetical protein
MWSCQVFWIYIFEGDKTSKCNKWISVFRSLTLQTQYFSDTDYAPGYVIDRPHAYINFTPVYTTYPPHSEHNQLCVDEFHFPKLQRF